MVSRRITPVYPLRGLNVTADQIRERRGPRGLTALDGTLLHASPIASGWNQLLGAVRTKGKLPGDIRELLILRVAAHNYAAYEWIHHEPLGRDAGLTTTQLLVIRDVSRSAPLSSSPKPLTSLQAAALAFADASTKDVKVADSTFDTLVTELKILADERSVEQVVQELVVEATALVASYNMVSRFLVALDVAGKSNDLVPWPVDREEHTIPILESEVHGINLFAVKLTIPSLDQRPWLIFANSLLTNTSLWSSITPVFISRGYNIILFDQRGHGQSSIPPSECTMPELGRDIAHVLDYFKIQTVEAVVGVSQGAASALSFSIQYPGRSRKIIACDTQAKAPELNKQAWEDRIKLAKSSDDGMERLAVVTAQRWFPASSAYHSVNPDFNADANHDNPILKMIATTPRQGFERSARALQTYDLLADGLLRSNTKTLLIAGEKDGGGVISKALQLLTENWVKEGGNVRFAEVKGGAHLPMVGTTEQWIQIVGGFLQEGDD